MAQTRLPSPAWARPLALAGDIRTWLAVVLLIRLVGMTSAPLETSHSWRQAFTNMVARNLAEGPFDLLHPRTDLAGEREDVVASEFPGFNALIAGMLRAFGPAHWYGRLIALLVSTLGAWSFHALLRKRFGDRVAFLSTIVLLFSAWFIYGRKAMPDTFSLALVLIALWLVDRALREDRTGLLLAAVPLAALGGLCKIPAVVLFIPWGLMVLQPGLPFRLRWRTAMALALASAPVLWWYFHWQPHLLERYGNALYFPFTLMDGYASLQPYTTKLVERFTFSALMSHVAFAAMLVGGWRMIRDRDRASTLLIACTAALFGYFILKTGDVFALHAYYILPIVPLMALLAGMGLAALPRGRWTAVVLMLVIGEAMGMRWSDLTGGAEREHLLKAEELADQFTAHEALVGTVADMDPRPMYYLHRHGWNLKPAVVMRKEALDSLHALGLEALFVDRHASEVQAAWPLLYEDPDWRVHGPGTP